MSLKEARISQLFSSGIQYQTEASFVVGSKEALPLLQHLNFSGPALLYGKLCLSFALGQCSVASQSILLKKKKRSEILLEKSKALIVCYLRAKI